MNSQFYNIADGGKADATRLKLALFDRQTVQDIVDLIRVRGAGVVNDVFDMPTEADPAHVLGVLSPEYIKYSDLPAVIVGMSTMIMGQLRSPKLGPDEYANMLSTAYNIPVSMARYYANQIDSTDKMISDGNKDGNTSLVESATYYSNRIKEGARNFVNRMSTNFGLDNWLNWDQTQEFDLDMMDELASLGEIVAKLNRRNRLMSAQAAISANMNIMRQGGDPLPDAAAIDAHVGDVFSKLGTKPMPNAIMGNYAPLATNGMRSAFDMARTYANMAGYRNGKYAGTPSSPQGEDVRKSMGDVLTGEPSQSHILGAMGNLIPGAGLLKLLSGLFSAGDPNDEIMGDIAETYGDQVAQRWYTGDIEGLVGDALIAAAEGISPQQADAYGDISEDMGDIDESLDKETGGLFSRWRSNMAFKRAERVQNRQQRKATKRDDRAQKREQRFQNRRRSRNTDMESFSRPRRQQPQYEEPEEQEPQYQAPQYSQPDDGGGDDQGVDPSSFGNFSPGDDQGQYQE